MDPSQGYVIHIGINGNTFTKSDWNKRRKEGYIINPPGLHFWSVEHIPAYTNTHIVCRIQETMSTLRCKKRVIKEPSLSPRDHLPLPTPPTLLPINQARHCDTAASVFFPESSFEARHKLKTT